MEGELIRVFIKSRESFTQKGGTAVTTKDDISVQKVVVSGLETQGTSATGVVELQIYEHTQSFPWTANLEQRGWTVVIKDLTLNSEDLASIKHRIIEEVHRRAKGAEVPRSLEEK